MLNLPGMSRDRWLRIEAVVDRVLDAAESDRGAILADACGSDEKLRAEVELFLTACDEAETLFNEAPRILAHEAFADTTAPRERDALDPGDVVGAYRVVEEIGAGGMGAVYLAERADGSFQKRVALKVIKRGLDTDEIVERFRNERQIVARLEHPNIAALLDGGATDTGLPYFVMELATGDPIDDYCDVRGLDLDGRLRLFLIVCDAVQYAHRNLIVHRDLKPSNIVVAHGDPKLLDFGIAKVLDPDTGSSDAATRLPERRLTPEYAAPEQVLGLATTTATDIYSLGVILYKLVSGRLPYSFATRSMSEIEHVVCEAQPLPPSVVAATHSRERVPADLDAIVLQALHKEPERRYGSTLAMAEDIARFLEGRTVNARPDTGLYRLSKFVRRNLPIVGLTVAAAVTLVAATLVTGSMALEARSESERRQSDSELRLAEARRATAAKDFLVGLFSSGDPSNDGAARAFSRDELVRLGLERLQRLDDDPVLRATVMNTLAQVVLSLGEIGRADSLYEASYRLLGDMPQLERATSLMGRGAVARAEGRPAAALPLFEEALRLRRELGGGQDEIGEALLALAATQVAASRTADAGSLPEARRLYEEALALDGVSESIRERAREGMAGMTTARSD